MEEERGVEANEEEGRDGYLESAAAWSWKDWAERKRHHTYHTPASSRMARSVYKERK